MSLNKINIKFCIIFITIFHSENMFTCSQTQSIPKVKIGIKKRVDCNMRTKKGDFIHVHYRGTLFADGSEFDNSYSRNNPLTFTLGNNQVIKGWEQGLLGMCEGEKRRLVIPSELGYGKTRSISKIPPDSTLVFDVELIKIERKNEL